MSSSSPGSKIGTLPARKISIFRESLSTQVTLWPTSAKQAPVTRPTYPEPMIETSIRLLFLTNGRECYANLSCSRLILTCATRVKVEIKAEPGKCFQREG